MTTIPSVDVTALHDTIQSHIRESGAAEFGVFVKHLQSGATVEVNADALYPMASTFKVPILLEAMAQVDAGERRLDERIELRAEDQLPTSMIIGNLDPGLRLTFRDILTAMIIASDNAATDMALKHVGGPERVMARLREWGFTNIAVHMGVAGLFDVAFSYPDTKETMPQVYRRVIAAGPIVDPATGATNEELAAATRRGANWDAITAKRTLENNVTSPREMGLLLERLVRGELLSASSTLTALGIMLRQQLNARLPRFMPPGVAFAHKTGTFYSSRNDAGIIYLPDGGRLIVATFGIMDRARMEGDPLETVPYIDAIDGCMGHIARSAYDTFSQAGGEA